jgi:hypothetical protein
VGATVGFIAGDIAGAAVGGTVGSMLDRKDDSEVTVKSECLLVITQIQYEPGKLEVLFGYNNHAAELANKAAERINHLIPDSET